MLTIQEKTTQMTLEEFKKSPYRNNPVFVEDYETYIASNQDLTQYKGCTLRPTQPQSVDPYRVTEDYIGHMAKQGVYVEGEEIYEKLEAVNRLMADITVYYQEKDGYYEVITDKEIIV